MANSAQSLLPKAVRGSSSGGLTLILAVAAVGGGLYFLANRPTRREPVQDDMVAQIAALARVEKDAENLQRATREHRAIVGMTLREVELAKGRPRAKQRGSELPEPLRARGGAENWIYDSAGGEVSVLFAANGQVIYSGDVGDKPTPQDAIRR